MSALCEAAEKEYRLIKAADPTHLMALPFGKPIVAPDVLYNLSFLLAGMQIGKTMRVLDFGAGVCWLSRHLNEMGCATISLDPSRPGNATQRARITTDLPQRGKAFLDWIRQTIAAWT